MKLILLTQDDPFFLPELIQDFIKKINIQNKYKFIGAIVSSPSPFGRDKTFVKKILKTFNVFGFKFFLFYAVKYFSRKYIYKLSVVGTLQRNMVPIIKLKNNINSYKNISIVKKYKPDIIMIISGNQILKKDFLNIPKYGVFNIHSSLLPYYKGLMPTFWVLKNKEKETGVTLYKLTEGIDDGPIVSQTRFKLNKNITHAELVVKSKLIGNDLILNSFNRIKNNKFLKIKKGGSYYKFPTKNDVIEFYNKGNFFF